MIEVITSASVKDGKLIVQRAEIEIGVRCSNQLQE